MNQPTKTPTKKMQAVGVGGALGVIIVFIAGQFGLEIPPEAASAIVVVISWIAGYMRPEMVQKLVEAGAKMMENVDEDAG